MADVIRLGQPSKEDDVIRLGGTKTDRSIGAQLRRLEKAPTPIRVLGSPKLTGTLGGLLIGGPMGAVKGLFGAGIVEGLIETSPTIEKAITKRLKTGGESAGEAIGTFIEETPKKVKETTQKIEEKIPTTDKIVKALKTAGLVGAGATAGAVASKVIEKVKKVKEQLPSVSQGVSTTLPSVSPITRQTTPLGSVQPSQTIPEKAVQKPKAVEKKPKPMKITQNVNLKVNQKVYKRRNTLLEYGIYA